VQLRSASASFLSVADIFLSALTSASGLDHGFGAEHIFAGRIEAGQQPGLRIIDGRCCSLVEAKPFLLATPSSCAVGDLGSGLLFSAILSVDRIQFLGRREHALPCFSVTATCFHETSGACAGGGAAWAGGRHPWTAPSRGRWEDRTASRAARQATVNATARDGRSHAMGVFQRLWVV